MQLTRLLRAILLVSIFAWPTGEAAVFAAEPPAAGAFLAELSRRAVDQLSDTGVPEAERERRFHALLTESFDIGAIGRFVLGRYWRAASEDERQAFLDVFKDVITHRFLPMFAGYQGEKLKVGEVRRAPENPDVVNVSTMISRPSGGPAQVTWRIRQSDGHRILDVVVEGVSMAITLRSEYGSFIQRHGGDVTALVEGLRKRVGGKSFSRQARR
jgi:phospholipid transport system substrate-binding protein